MGRMRTKSKVKQTPLFTEKIMDDPWVIHEFFWTDLKPPKQLLKWIGNKQRFAQAIANVFPKDYNRYIEPFLGSGAVLGAMAPKKGLAGDAMMPLIELWRVVQEDPQSLYDHYLKCWLAYQEDPKKTYTNVLSSFNENPNPLDFAFISRTCYGGVIRFTKQGRMSTPMGPHKPIHPDEFKERIALWRQRVTNTEFRFASFEETMGEAKKGDIVYCDPPYFDSQAILYGAQAFKLSNLWVAIERCKKRGALVALSIDGKKKSGTKEIELNIPHGLFERQLLIEGGSSMLKRFQKKDEAMIGEDVHDRLLLTW